MHHISAGNPCVLVQALTILQVTSLYEKEKEISSGFHNSS